MINVLKAMLVALSHHNTIAINVQLQLREKNQPLKYASESSWCSWPASGPAPTRFPTKEVATVLARLMECRKAESQATGAPSEALHDALLPVASHELRC